MQLEYMLCLPGTVAVLAGQSGAPPEIVDGPATTGRFNQPRGICQSPATRDLFVLDGVGNTAVLRHIDISTSKRYFIACDVAVCGFLAAAHQHTVLSHSR